MDKDFISLYNREMSYAKELLAEFSQRYPKAAAALRFDQFSIEDPHTARLVEAFAFLSAGVKSSLDDDYFELLRLVTSQHLLAPLPRLGLVKVSPDSQAEAQLDLPKGTLLELPVDNIIHYYQTCFDTDILPLRLDRVRYGSLIAEAPPLPARGRFNEQKQALLSLNISPLVEGNTLEGISANRLRFLINGSPALSFLLYEHLLSGLQGIALARHPKDPEAIYLPASSLQAPAMEKSEVLLPIADQDRSVNRLLLEYFLLPEKFLFIDLDGLFDAEVWQTFQEGFTLYFYLEQHSLSLLNGINDEILQLGCTPVVNLFDDRCVLFDQQKSVTEMPLRASSDMAGDISIFDIHRIQATDTASGQQVPLLPLDGAARYTAMSTTVSLPYWSLHQGSPLNAQTYAAGPYLKFVDESGRESAMPSGWRVTVSMQCMNRSGARRLDEQNIRFSQAVSADISLHTFPEMYDPLCFDAKVLKSLMTQLSLQHFSGPDGLQALKNVLSLHNLRGLEDTHKVIHSMGSMELSSTSARLMIQGRARLMQGVHIHIGCDYEVKLEGQIYLLSQLLSEFFSYLCTQNTFTQLTMYNSHQSQSFAWPPTMGKSPLI